MILFKDTDQSTTEIQIITSILKKEIDVKLFILDLLSIEIPGAKFSPKVKAGIWDGKKNFYKIKKNKILIPRGLVPFVINRLKNHKLLNTQTDPDYEIKSIELPNNLDYCVDKNILDNFITELKLPFQPYDYQKNGVLLALTKKKGILKSATGSGKSLIIYIIICFLKSKGYKGLLIVPSITLVNQMKSDFIDYGCDFKDDIHLIFGGEKKEFNKSLVISTWQSLQKVEDLSYSDYVLCDECHTVKSEVYEKIIMPGLVNCGFRMGFTGTIPKEFIDHLSLIGSLGNPHNIISARELIDLNLATPVEVKTIIIKYKTDFFNPINQQPQSHSEKNSNHKRKKLDYITEKNLVEINTTRMTFLSKFANKVSETGNTIILFNTINFGMELLNKLIALKVKEQQEYIFLNDLSKKNLDLFLVNLNIDEVKNKILIINTMDPAKIKIINERFGFIFSCIKTISSLGIFLIIGDTDSLEREDIRKTLEDREDVILLGTFGCLSTGVNIKRIHNIVLSSPTKSFIRLNQTIGRGMRLHKDKNKVKIFDLVDDIFCLYQKNKNLSLIKKDKINYGLLHYLERQEIYSENEYPITEVEVEI